MSATIDQPLRPNRPDVIDEEFEGESVLVNLQTGCYFALNPAATEIWSLLQDGRTAESVAASRGAGLDETVAFIAELVEHDLVDAAPEDAGVIEFARGASEAPALQLFTDMQDLLMLDPIHDIDLGGDGWPVVPAQA